MGLKMPRFRVYRCLVVVAVCAIGIAETERRRLWYCVHSERCAANARAQLERLKRHQPWGYSAPLGPARSVLWAELQAKRYAEAARRPWLPCESDEQTYQKLSSSAQRLSAIACEIYGRR
jgi:hypothetical protein